MNRRRASRGLDQEFGLKTIALALDISNYAVSKADEGGEAVAAVVVHPGLITIVACHFWVYIIGFAAKMHHAKLGVALRDEFIATAQRECGA